MRNIRKIHPDDLVQATRAARALNNVGWRLHEIAEALDMSENDIKELLEIKTLFP